MTRSTAIKTLIAIYYIGFVVTLIINILSGPVTPGLAFARATGWPLWITTGIPHGTTARMD